jgi:3-oxoacyl-[acyl-carrier-protein] synthase-1
MKTPLNIDGFGAVTPVGLDAPSSCASIRAGISRIAADHPFPPPMDPQYVALVKARHFLRPTPTDWLLNLATRALKECVRDEPPPPDQVALFICPPERFRKHPGLDRLDDTALLQQLRTRTGIRITAHSAVLHSGQAGIVEGLSRAHDLIATGRVTHCIVGGVDSLANAIDIERLRKAARLYVEGNPQAVIPGEGAAFVCVSGTHRGRRLRSLGQILGVGTARESKTALGPEFSQGDAMREALGQACDGARVHEGSLGWVSSTFNGERYGAWEAMLFRPRFYRTRREHLPITYPAMAVGEMGTAAGALSIIVAAMAITRGYAPGGYAMCEMASEEGLRGACIVGPSPNSPAWAAPGVRAPV